MKNTQRSFAFGEVAPALYARPDLAMYSQALRTLRNAYVMRAGGVQSRPGTMRGITTKQQDARVRLVPCIFSDEQNYMLEFGNQYVRVLLQGDVIRVPSSGNWADDTEYALGVVVSQSTVVGVQNFLCIQAHTSIEADNRPLSGTDWEDYWYEMESGSFPPLVWPTPYTTAQIDQLQFAQTPGVVTIVHPSHPVKQLTRVTATQWTLANLSFVSPGEVTPPDNFVAEIDTTGLAAWVTATSYALNALVTNNDVVYRCISAHTSGASSAPGTGASWETYWKIKGVGGDDEGFWYVVTAYDDVGNQSNASATQKLDFSQNPLSPTWRTVILSWDPVPDAVAYSVYRSFNSTSYQRIGVTGNAVFYDSNPTSSAYIYPEGPPQALDIFEGANNYPSAVSFYQQRLLLAATNNAPDTVWASVTGRPFDFSVRFPLQDDDLVSWRQLSRQAIEIRHLVEIGRRLVAFTNIGEYIITGADDGVLRPGEVNPTVYSYNGANGLSPIVIDNTALYVQARGSRVLRISPEYQDEPAGSDLSLLATHLLEGYEIVSWAYQEVPNSLVWMVRNDGVLLCLSYVREAGITAWSKCDTQGFVESVCCVPEGNEDVVYLVVVHNGIRRIQRIVNRLAEDPICLDDAYYIEILVPIEVTDLPPDETYRYATVRLASPYTFNSNDVGAWIQILRDGAAWIAWEISEILTGGIAKIRIAIEDAPLESAGDYSAEQWAYRAADVAPDPLVVVDDPDAPIPGAAYVTDGLYDGEGNVTSATVNITGPVFTDDSVGSKLLLKIDGEFDAWTIEEVLGAMTVEITHAGEIENFEDTYIEGDWIYRPKELDDYADGDAVTLIDGLPLGTPEPFIGADIVGAKMYATDSTQRQQGTAQLYYSDDNVTYLPGPVGYVTNDETGEWDGDGLGSCGIKYWLGTTPAVMWADVQPGAMSTIGLKFDGTLWGWGTNNGVDQDSVSYTGLLGLGNSYPGSNVPVQIGSDKWRAIAVGNFHFAAIRSDGTLWATGRNDKGQLGVGNTTDRTVLTQIGSDSDWVKVYAGPETTMAIRSNGTLWAAGDNTYGNLGVGDQTNRISMTQVGIGTNWEMVSTSQYYSMALKSNGTLWTCGYAGDLTVNAQMSLGGTIPSTYVTSYTQIGSDSDWTHVAVGAGSLAIKQDGTLWITGTPWGVEAPIPRPTASGLVDEFEQVINGGSDWAYATCSNWAYFAIKTDGTLWVWGENRDLGGPFPGRLGLGDYNVRTQPTQLGNSKEWLVVRAGNEKYNGKTAAVFGIRKTLNSFGNQGELLVWGRRWWTDDYDNFGIETQTPFTAKVPSPELVYGVVAVIGQKRYWRYVAGEGHPTISKLWLIDRAGVEYFYAEYGADNCSGTGGVPSDDPDDNPGVDIPSVTPVGDIPSYRRLLIGLPYNVDIETLDVDGPQRSVKNDAIRVGEVFVWLDRSGSFYVGPKATNDTTQLELYTPQNDEGYPLPAGELYTGVAPVTLKTTYTRNGRIFIRQPDPKPLTVTAIIADGLINGRG